jgi:hypothetical protein
MIQDYNNIQSLFVIMYWYSAFISFQNLYSIIIIIFILGKVFFFGIFYNDNYWYCSI